MDELSKAKRAGMRTITSISEAELAMRMCEVCLGIKRPPELTAEQTLDSMEPNVRAVLRAQARAAMEYWLECIEKMKLTH